MNDPNGYWASPTCILDLIGKVVGVSVATRALVNELGAHDTEFTGFTDGS